MAAIKAGCAATWRHRQSLTAITCVCVFVCVRLCVHDTPASVALPREIDNCCGQVTRGLRLWRPPKTINTRVILRISADKCTIKTFQEFQTFRHGKK